MPVDRVRTTQYWLGRSVHKWRRDMVWGVTFGLAMAALYSLIAIVIYVFAGQEPFAAYEISLGEALIGYWAGGLLGGAIFGVLRPLARKPFGAIVVGIVVAVPASAAIIFTIDENAPWQAVIIMALIFGTIGGVAFSGRSGPGDRETEEFQEAYAKLLAGELSEEEEDAFVKRYGAKEGEND